MAIINNEFIKLYEDLSQLNGDEQPLTATPLYFETIRADLEANPSLWWTVKDIATQISSKFNNNYKWWYQFQLMYNAYQTEKYTLELLHNKEFREKLQNALTEKVSSAKRVLADDYAFNDGKPNMHNEFSVALVERELDNKPNYVDIIAVSTQPAKQELIDAADASFDLESQLAPSLSDSPEGTTNESLNESIGDYVQNIEVKATVGNNAVRNTHQAELVFVYYLDRGIFNVEYRGYLGKWAGKVILTDICQDILERCISVNCNIKMSITKFKSAKAETKA